jgi:hypothetical protein
LTIGLQPFLTAKIEPIAASEHRLGFLVNGTGILIKHTIKRMVTPL